MSHGKDIIVHLIVGLIKRFNIKMSQYFPKPFRSFGRNINVKVIFQVMQQKQIYFTC